MRKIREVIVVEGRYDKNTLKQVVDATVVETNGFGVFNDPGGAAILKGGSRPLQGLEQYFWPHPLHTQLSFFAGSGLSPLFAVNIWNVGLFQPVFRDSPF